MSGDWRDDPDVKAAIARAAELAALPWTPGPAAEAEVASRGLHPVSVVHGDPEDEEAVELVCGRLARLADRLGCRSKVGGNDAATYLLPSAEAAAEFIADVTSWCPSWWTVTPTARPVYRGGLG